MFNYETVVSSYLKVDSQFLDNHGETIHTRLKAIYDALKTESKDAFGNRDIFAVNQCLHLATSIALLGSSSSDLQKTIDIIRAEAKFHNDPTTVITISTLYYLLSVYMDTENKDRNIPEYFDAVDWQTIVEHIHKRLDAVNWMIGREDMEVLGIEVFSKNGNG